MISRLSFWGTLFLGLLFCGAAMAEEAPASEEKDFFGVSAGIKGGVGGNYISKPSGVRTYEDDLAFADGAGGVGGGAGLYTEFRILWGWLGVELDVMFDKSKNWCNIDYGPVDTKWIVSATAVRLPLLLKGNVDGEKTRVSLGIGPEFVIIKSTETDLEADAVAGIDQLKRRFTSRAATDTFLCFDLGLAIKVWRLAITFDLRFSYNVGQPKEYAERVDYSGDSSENFALETLASNTLDGRILLGVAYEFGFNY